MSASTDAAAAPASPLSFTALTAGVLTAFGAFAVLISLVAGIAKGADVTRTLSGGTWDHLGTTGGVLVASMLLLAWLYGGYVAGRMAGRDGYRHGVWMFVLGILVVVTVAAIVSRFDDTASVLQGLRVIGLPVRRREWKEVISVPGVASLVAMFAGAVLGAALGETSRAARARPAVEEELAVEPVPAPEPVRVREPEAVVLEPAAVPEPEPAEAEPEPSMTSLWDDFMAEPVPAGEGEPEPEPQPEPSLDREEVIRARDREDAGLGESHDRPWLRPAAPVPDPWAEPAVEPVHEPLEPEPFLAEPVPTSEPEPFFAEPVPESVAADEPVAADESVWAQPPPSYEPPPAIESYPIAQPPPRVPLEQLDEEGAARRRQEDEAARAYEAAREDWP